MRLLVIEDHPHLRNAVAGGLTQQGWAVDASGDGEEGLWYAGHNDYDLAILDLGLPGMPGEEVLRRLRALGKAYPVLVLTAREAVSDRVRLLDLGADDYLVKPFDPEELLARCRALLRRGHQRRDPCIRIGSITINTASRQVEINASAVALGAKEYALLEYLASNRGRVVSRSELWEHLYDFNAEATSNVIDATIAHLRRKLNEAGGVDPIRTRRGEGYLIEDVA